MVEEASGWTIISAIATLAAAIFTGTAAFFTRKAANASWASVKEMAKEREAERKDRQETQRKERPLLQLAGIQLANNPVQIPEQPDYKYIIALSNPKRNKLLRLHYVLAFNFKGHGREQWVFFDSAPLHLHGMDRETFVIHADINDIPLNKMEEIEISGFFKLIDTNRGEDNYVSHALHKVTGTTTGRDSYTPQQPVHIQVIEGNNFVSREFGVVLLHLDVNDNFIRHIQANVGKDSEIENCGRNEGISAFIDEVYKKSDNRMDFVLFD